MQFACGQETENETGCCQWWPKCGYNLPRQIRRPICWYILALLWKIIQNVVKIHILHCAIWYVCFVNSKIFIDSIFNKLHPNSSPTIPGWQQLKVERHWMEPNYLLVVDWHISDILIHLPCHSVSWCPTFCIVFNVFSVSIIPILYLL